MPNWLANSAVAVALVSAVTTVISKVVDGIFGSKHKQIMQSQESIFDTLKTLNGDTIQIKNDLENVKKNSKDITRYRLFHDMTLDIVAGYTTLERKREIAKLFASYKMLDGNGEIEMMYKNEFIELPLKEEIK